MENIYGTGQREWHGFEVANQTQLYAGLYSILETDTVLVRADLEIPEVCRFESYDGTIATNIDNRDPVYIQES